MSKASRDKGKAGEREAAAILRDITGLDLRRRVRQDDGDSDLVGIPGWSVEVKRHATASTADVDRWWSQAVAQARWGQTLPLLIYRADRQDWRCRWPLSALLAPDALWDGAEWSVDTTPQAWGAVWREVAARQGKSFDRLLEVF